MSTQRRLLQILSVIVVLAMLFSGFSLPAALAQGGDGLKRQHNAHTGKISFIGPESGRALPARKALGIPPSTRLADPAMALAKRFGPEFGLKSPARDLKEKKTNRSANGRLAVHYQQSYQGVPVMGGELIVNTNKSGDLYSINGEISPDLSLSTQPTVDSEQARQAALVGAAKWYQKAPEDFVASAPELWIYDESLVQPSTRPAELVWRMEVTLQHADRPVRELVLVNAERGNISLHFNQVDTTWSLSGKTGIAQDIQPTSTPQPTETLLPAEVSTEVPEAISTATPTPTPMQSGEEASPPDSKHEVESLTDGTWYVSTTGNDSNSCSLPASPCATIQAAINKASSGNTIAVAEGTYYYTSINANPNVVIINKSITLSGGWQSDFSSQTGASIIDGESVNNGILANAGGSTVVVERFVIQNSHTGNDSGGIYLYANNFTLKNSSVVNNTGGRGAGVFMIGNANLIVLNSTLSGNRAGASGGAIHAVNGTVTINNSTIAHNNSNATGGGIGKDSGTVSIQNSILALNTATTGGPDCSGSMDASHHNIVGNTTGCAIASGAGDQFNVDPLIDSALTGSLPLHTLQITSPAVNAGDNSTCLSSDQRGTTRPQGSSCDIGSYELVTSKSISTLSGSNQSTQVSTAFALPLSALVIDEFGNPANGVAVTFTAPASEASGVFADTGTHVTVAVADSNGIATSAIFTANDHPGGFTVDATAAGYDSPAVFNLYNVTNGSVDLYVSSSGSDSSSCTLPETACLTINAAINKAASGDVVAVASGTYTGSGTEAVLINKNVALSGGWDNAFVAQTGTSIIDGQGVRRAVVNTATNASIENFTIQGGYHATMGAGIYNTGVLTLSKSNVSGNISAWQGGGIHNLGTLTINDSSISNNHGGKTGYSGGGGGAGIQSSSGTVIVNNSSISNNIILGSYQASGIVNYGASFTLNNSTVSGNTGADAIYHSMSGGTLTLNNSTVSRNGKLGIRNNSGIVILQNSILANNYTSASGQDCAGTIMSSGYNLIGNTTGCVFTASTGDQTNVNPLLSMYLVGNPPYHALQSDSPAIDHGNPATCLSADQRGIARPQGGACDIGAYEYTTPGPAASFGISGRNNQRTGISFPFALPLLVYVVDVSGGPVSGANVTFTAPASGPSGIFADSGTNVTTVPTNNEGVAVPSTFTANSQWGTYEVIATVSDLSGSVSFVLTNVAWFVSPTGNNTNSCVAPISPCQTISGAIAKAADGDTLLVAVGTYAPASLGKSLTLLGGWDTAFTSQIGYSTVDGNVTSDGITITGTNVSISRFAVQNSKYGIYHSIGSLKFDRGALINNNNGIYNYSGDTTLTNTTISSNHSNGTTGSAINASTGTVSVHYSTIANNNGSYAIYSLNSSAHIIIGDSVLAGNAGGDCYVGSTNMTSTGHNIFGRSPVCSSSTGPVLDPSDQAGVDPQLSALLPVGYHPISSTSPALDHANPVSCPATDQRGAARPQGTACDIGAYEYTASGAAASFGIASGSNQRSGPSLPFSLPLSVYVLDASGSPVSGVNVTFTAPASGPGGTFADTGTNTTSVVSSEGLAVSPVFTANAQLGSYNVTATVAGLPGSASFVLANAAWYVAPTGNDSNACSSPAAPCLTINGAIGKATKGDVIKVAVGTYTTSSSAVANVTKDLNLSGGWNSTFSEQTGFSILDGNNRAYHGISAGVSNVSISRFIVQNSFYGISHSGGALSFEHGALINNRNGIYNVSGDTTFTNTTISGNIGGGIAGSAVSNVDGVITIRYSTITNNGRGYAIYSGNGGAFIKIGNSILAGNGQDCHIGSNPSISEGYNIFGSQPACSGSVVLQSTDKVGTDPKLLLLFPLGYYPILPDSPAVDAANPAVCTATDQRGVTRPVGSGCDIGAYEYTVPGTAASFGIASGSNQHVGPAMPFLLPLTVFVTDVAGSPVSGVSVTFTAPASGPGGTFADTGTNTTAVVAQNGLAVSPIFTANSEVGSYNVTATATGLPGSVSFALTNAAWYVAPTGSDSNACSSPAAPCLTINGAIGKATTGDAIKVAVGTYTRSSSPVVNITKDLNLSGGWNSTFSEQTGFSIIDGSNKTYNGISSDSFNVSISRFIVQNSGYGIYHYRGALSFERGALINNKSGLYNYEGNTTLTNTTISGNGASNLTGSAISNQAGVITIRYSTITNNSGGSYAIYSSSSGASIKIGNSILAGNSQDCHIGSNPSISEGYNIFGSQPACSGSVVLQPTDKVGTDPRLLPLFPLGYHPVLQGSPAVDAANPAVCLATDQRGVSRPVGEGCDIGAFEYHATGTIPAYIIAYEGSPQSIALGRPASTRLKAAVLDEMGDGVPGQTVTFTGPASGASLVFADTSTYISTVVTDANGIATSPDFSANNIAGNYIVAATVTGLASSANFELFNDLYSYRVKTYTARNGTSLPGTFLCDQSLPSCTNNVDPHADAAHKYAMGTYNLYMAQYQRDSIDNHNMAIVSTVHFASGYANAGWTGAQMVYGDAYGFALADDVVAHELTHGVTQYESSLFYYYQSGAINESFSDLWGEYYDQTNGQGNDAESAKWLMGEDVSGLGAIRSLSDPTAYGDPDKISSPNYYTGASDNGGVHTNSGINNKAVFLMAQGGSFNGKTVSALGWDKTAAIYYEANTNLLSSGADYSDLYYALQQACTNLIGQKGITSGDCAEVRNAVDAVEMNGQPVANFNMDAPYCDPGNTRTDIFSDGLESGTGNWTFTNGAYPRWQLDSPYGQYAHSGNHFLYANDYPGTVADAIAQLTPVTLPSDAFLHFAHAHDLQSSGSYYYDGGVLEYSIDGGSTWNDAGSLIDFNGYKGTISSGNNNPLQGRSAFVGSSHGYISTRLNLADFAGQTITFRWRMGLDQSSYAWGWWLDDVRIYRCLPADPTPPTVASIIRAGMDPSSAASVDFTATFSEPVTGVDVNDFDLDMTGNLAGARITSLTGSGSTWTVTVDTGSGDGTLGLNVPVGAEIRDLAGNSLEGLPFSSGERYTIDKTAPVVSSIVRAGPNPTAAASVDFTATFSEPVMAVDVNNFDLVMTGNLAGAGITNLTGSGATWTVTVNTGSGDGTLGLDLNVDLSITDLAGNRLAQEPFAPDEEYTIDKTHAFLVAPGNGELLPYRRPTFDWSDVPNASRYRITASRSSSFSTVLWEGETTDSIYTPGADLPGGQVIYWRVGARLNDAWGPWSETWSFTTGNPPSIPALASPANNSLTQDYTPLLNWNDATVPGGAAAFDHYQVQVATDQLFTLPVLIDEGTPTGQITASSYTPATDLAANTAYFWRVRSYNVSGQYSSWSAVRSFRTALLPPGNLTPADGETVSSRQPILDWDAVAGAEGYDIQISTSSSFSTLLVNASTTTDTFTPGANLPVHKTIYWRVRTTGANGPGSWTTASFTTP